jgi:hypothetical protein
MSASFESCGVELRLTPDCVETLVVFLCSILLHTAKCNHEALKEWTEATRSEQFEAKVFESVITVCGVVPSSDRRHTPIVREMALLILTVMAVWFWRNGQLEP